MLRDSITPSPSSFPPSSVLFSPLSFFHSQKANDQLSTHIDPLPLAYPKPIEQPPCSQTVSLPSMSAKVCLLTETILLLEALLKERTPTPPLFQLFPPLQLFHSPPPSYHQVDPHPLGPLPSPTPCMLQMSGTPHLFPLFHPPHCPTPYGT